MNSAAVISRQIRNQQSSGRSSTSYSYGQKNRPRASFHQLHQNYLTTSTATNINEDLSLRHYYFNDQLLHKDDKKEQGSRLKCTCHCLCVTLKAMSGGLVLLIVGTTMSLIGFIADAQHNFSETLANGTVVERPLPSVFRNLTFAGPVLMGLGTLMIIAAMVLVFEVRDVLGVKTETVKIDSVAISDPTPPIVETKGSRSYSIANFTKCVQSWNPLKKFKECNVKNIDLKENLQLTKDEGKTDASVLASNNELSVTTRNNKLEETSNKLTSNSVESLPGLQSSTSTDLKQGSNIQLTYFNLSSPQATNTSDFEGCSSKMPSSWQSSRCSCSHSPTLSSDQIFHDQEPINITVIEKDTHHH